MIDRNTYIELTKFGIVGGMSFGADLAVYYTLTELFGMPTYVSKSISVICATLFNYYLNTKWTWGQTGRDKKRFAQYMSLYIVSGVLNVVANEFFLRILPDKIFQMSISNNFNEHVKPFFAMKMDKILAVILATMVGMIVNFIGQKAWIFKKSAEDVTQEIFEEGE